MILQCEKCGGLFGTEHLETFAGKPCWCESPTRQTAPAPSYVILSTEAHDALVNSDAALLFAKRVSDAAVQNPLWKENYALALYHAFVVECQARALGLLKNPVGSILVV